MSNKLGRLDQVSIDGMNAIKAGEEAFAGLIVQNCDERLADPRLSDLALKALDKAVMYASHAAARPTGYREPGGSTGPSAIPKRGA